MQRYNPFNMIHKGLRAMLYDTALTLQQTNFADNVQAEISVGKIEAVLFLFEQHAHHEDNSVLPAIEMYEPELVQSFEKEHITDIALGDKLNHLLNIFRHTDIEAEKAYCGSAITKSFIEFMIFNLEHMSKEEILINQALWKHYTDEQLMLLNQKIVSSIPAKERSLGSRWMLRGVNDEEAINWLRAIKGTIPAAAFQPLIDQVEAEFPEERREKVLNSVMQPEMADY